MEGTEEERALVVLMAEIKGRGFPCLKSCRKVDKGLEHSTGAGKKVVLGGSTVRTEGGGPS